MLKVLEGVIQFICFAFGGRTSKTDKMKASFALVLLIVGVAYAETGEKFKDLFIGKHNELRRKQSGSDMNELVWNDTLAQTADNWLSRCVFDHESKGFGENLAFNTAQDDESNILNSFKDWYDEINNFNYGTNKCNPGKVCGHYTQLVWAKTRQVGCAYRRCPSLSAFGQGVSDAWYVGCWYYPPGNDISEKPFSKEGSACDACWEGQKCDDGLCTGVGKEKCEDKDPMCVTYEAGGACTSNKKFMEKKCRQSCGFCTGGPKKECKDVSPDCSRYKVAQCSQNVAWMKPNCMKFCGFC